MEWFSVKDKLPTIDIEDGDFKTSKKVIAFFVKGDEYWSESVTLKLLYDSDKPEWYYDYDSEMVQGNKITHWMPFIKPE